MSARKPTLRKRRALELFSAAAATYEEAAAAQQEVAALLAAKILEDPPPEGGTLLEIGCGTGLLTRHLIPALPGRRLLITDLSEAMVERCEAIVRETLSSGVAPHALGEDEPPLLRRIVEGHEPSLAGWTLEGHEPSLVFRTMDGEWPDVAPASQDRIVSSLAFQWFDHLPSALERLRACLKPGGALLFTTVGADTFREWRSCLAREGIRSGAGGELTREALSKLATVWAEERIEVDFGSGRAFLRHLEALGARAPLPGYPPLGPGAMRRAVESFDGKVTYHVLFGLLGPVE